MVTTSQEAAVRYKTAIDEALAEEISALENANPRMIDIEQLKNLKTAVIISGGHNTPPRIQEHADKNKHKRQIKSFKLPFDAEDDTPLETRERYDALIKEASRYYSRKLLEVISNLLSGLNKDPKFKNHHLESTTVAGLEILSILETSIRYC